MTFSFREEPNPWATRSTAGLKPDPKVIAGRVTESVKHKQDVLLRKGWWQLLVKLVTQNLSPARAFTGIKRRLFYQNEVAQAQVEWQRFYSEVFVRSVDLSSVVVSPYKHQFSQIVFVLGDISLEALIAACREQWPNFLADTSRLSPLAATSAGRKRLMEKTYAFRCRGKTNGDKNAEDNATYMNVYELLIFALFWHWKFGKAGFLDRNGVMTYCPESCSQADWRTVRTFAFMTEPRQGDRVYLFLVDNVEEQIKEGVSFERREILLT